MQLSVLIPTLNGRALLEESLPFLFTALKPISSSEVIVIDNNSIDGTAQVLKEQYPEVIQMQLSRNHGFTGAVNVGAQHAQGKYLLILNNDCLVEQNCISQMIQTLEKSEDVATQPTIQNPKKEIEQIGYQVNLKLGRASVLKHFDNAQWGNQSNLFQTSKVRGLSGTCLLIKADVFHQIGQFDESFHSYLEDVDLFIRLAKASFKFIPTPEAVCIHHHMSTSKKMGRYKQWHDLTNWIRIIVKNYPFSFLMIHFFSLLLERGRNLSGWLKG